MLAKLFKRACCFAVMLFTLTGCQENRPRDYYVSDESEQPMVLTSGEPFHFADYKGKWLVVNYWASWCEPCRKEIPELVKLQQANKDIVVVGVNYDFIGLEKVRKLMQQFGVTYPVLMTDPVAQLGEKMIEVLPTTFIISPDGKIIARKMGEQTAKELESIITKEG